MAAPVAVAGSSPGLCPSFAVVCSFLERYGTALDLPELTFPQMERYLQETSSVPKPLVELHVKLLRKIGKSVTSDRWEKYLVKVCQEFNCTWAWELESKGYSEMTIESKTGILKYLCESQFDENIKFKTSVNEEDPDRMRLQPIGKDKEGLMYWFQVDQDQNVRVYVEEQDDLDGATWKCIVRNRNDLAQTLEMLKAKIDLGHSDRKQCDGSTCASPTPEDEENDADSEETKKGVTETKTSENSTDGIKTEGEEKAKSSAPKDTKEGQKEQNEKLKSKKDEEENVEVEMVINKKDVKPEEKPIIDNRVSTIISLVKEEPKESEVAWNAVSVVKAPGCVKQEVSAKAEVREETSEKTLEEVERTFKNDQQAKIPLKKRELKLSEGFGNNLNSNSNHHSNNTLNNNGTLSSGIIVRNPSVVLSKGPWPSKEEAPSPEEGRTVVCSKSSDVTGIGIKRETRPDICNGEIAPGRNLSLNVREHCVSVGVIMGPLDRKKSFVDHNVQGTADINGLAGNYIKTVTSCNNEGKGDPAAKHDGIPSPGTVRQSVLVRKAPTPEVVETILPKPFEGQVKRTPEADLSTVVVNKLDRKTEESSCLVNIPQSADETETKVFKETKPQTTEKSSECSGIEEEIAEEEEEEEEDEGTVGKGQGQAENKITEDLDGSPRAFSKESESGSSGDDGSEPDEGPDEVSSEIQKEGIRLKIKIPMHRRTPEFQREIEQEQQEASDGHSLRRSARICRPSPKLAEIQDRRQEKKHAGSSGVQEDKEPGDSEVRKNSQKKENLRKTDSDGQNKPGKMRRRHRRPRWTNSRSKGRKKGEGEEAPEEKKIKEGTQENYPSDGERHHSDSDSAQSAEMPNDDPCRHCGLPNHPELILLCDLCDNGYHTACLRPPLMIIPDGEWFCPPCQHKLLCERLEEQLQNLDTALKKKERAERRRERLVYVGISVENIIPTPQDGEGEEKLEKKKSAKKNKNLERRSTRTRKSISYRFDDFDEAIDEAIEEHVRETEGQGTGRGKDMATITGQQKRKEGKENQRPAKPTPARRRKKRRRLNDLDSDSTVDEEESEDDFHISSSTEEEEFVVSGDEAGSDGDAGSNDCSDWGSTASKPSQRRSKRSTSRGQVHRARTRGRGGRRPLSRQRVGLSDEDEEEELETDEEEEEEEMETEGDSDFSDSDVDTRRRRSRRSQRMQVNYCETSESEGSQKNTNRDKPHPHRRRLSSSNSEGSEEEKEDDKKTRKAKERPESSREDSRRLPLKRRRESTDDEDNSGEDDSDDESEEERPIRKRLNRIESEDEEGEEQDDEQEEEEEEEEEEDEDEEEVEEESEVKKTPSVVTNASSLLSPSRHRATVGPKSGGGGRLASKHNGSSRHNGLASQRPSTQDEDDDLYGVTDIVHFVFNSEQAL